MERNPIGKELNIVSKLFRDRVRKEASKYGLSETYFYVLNYIRRHSSKDITQKELCEEINVKASTMSVALKNMEEDGYIVKRKSNDDSRKCYVDLTDFGKQQVAYVKKSYRTVDDDICKLLGEDDLEKLYNCLGKIKELFEGRIKWD